MDNFQGKSFYNLMAASLTVTYTVTEIQNLVCDVCKKTINERKILPCSHSFCKAFLENLTTQNEENADGEGKKLDCPTCTTTVTLKANAWREIMDMIKYSSLRSPVICIHSNNAMHG